MPVDLGELKEMIEAALPGASVEVSDEDGGGQHLLATVTAPQFEGLSRIDQHRLGSTFISGMEIARISCEGQHTGPGLADRGNARDHDAAVADHAGADTRRKFI